MRKHLVYYLPPPADHALADPYKWPSTRRRGRVAPRVAEVFFDGQQWWARRYSVYRPYGWGWASNRGTVAYSHAWRPARYWGDGPPRGYHVDPVARAHGPMTTSVEQDRC